MRLRVYSNVGVAGRYWVYEVFAPDAPAGRQIRVSGGRGSWGAALETGCEFLRHYARRGTR